MENTAHVTPYYLDKLKNYTLNIMLFVATIAWIVMRQNKQELDEAAYVLGMVRIFGVFAWIKIAIILSTRRIHYKLLITEFIMVIDIINLNHETCHRSCKNMSVGENCELSIINAFVESVAISAVCFVLTPCLVLVIDYLCCELSFYLRQWYISISIPTTISFPSFGNPHPFEPIWYKLFPQSEAKHKIIKQKITKKQKKQQRKYKGKC